MSRPLLELRQVTKCFGGLTAVLEVDFTCSPGERVGVIGANGAGKTTLFNLMAGYDKVTSGQIYFDGQDVTRWSPYQICRAGLARTFQIAQPFAELTVRENLFLGCMLREKRSSSAWARVDALIDIFGFQDVSDHLTAELNTPNRKLLELARAYATQPRLILMDEVGAGLLPGELNTLAQMVLRLNKEQNIAFIVTEHLMPVITAVAQRVVVMHYGKKIADESGTAVFKNPEVRGAYLGGEDVLVAAN